MLTDTAIRNAKPNHKKYQLSDSGGLHLLVSPTGGKWWRLKYYYQGKERRMSLGTYPAVSLKQARERRDEARKQLALGIDPARKDSVLPTSFEAVAREWHERFKPSWSASYAEGVLSRLKRDVFPWIGKDDIKTIEAPHILSAVRRVEARGKIETAHRELRYCSQIFRYAIATGRATRDCAADLRGALPPPKVRHHAAILDPEELGKLLHDIDNYTGTFTVACALKLAPMLFVRPVELRRAEWKEIDLEQAEWTIPAEKMKQREPHLVPLPRQAVAILTELKPLTNKSRYVFSSLRSPQRPMSENTINVALRNMGYSKEVMTGHGFRATARTILDEVLHIRPEYIEHQLAHRVRDPLGRAYNRTKHLSERRKMMQQWADYLEGLKDGL